MLFGQTRCSCGDGQTISTGINGAAFTLAMLDELVDGVRPGRAELMLMSKSTRRRLKDLRRNPGYVLETAMNQFGQQIELYDGIPVVVDYFIKDDQAARMGSKLSPIYAVKFGQGAGVLGETSFSKR